MMEASEDKLTKAERREEYIKFRDKHDFRRKRDKREPKSDIPSIWPALEYNFRKFGIPITPLNRGIIRN